MLLELVLIEWKKQKGTILPWILGAAGIFASGVAVLFTATGNSEAVWESMTIRGFHFINMLSLLLAAVLTGLVFSGESSNNVDHVLFTYPVSRMKFLLSKYFVLLVMIAAMYLIFAVFLMLFGFLCIGSLPDSATFIGLLWSTLSLSAFYFLLVPLTSLVCQLVKGAGTGVFTGMAYFVVYVSFLPSKHSAWIPVCLPDSLVLQLFGTKILEESERFLIVVICAAMLIFSFAASAACYMKRDMA